MWLKEELFQRSGSFRPRSALSVMLDLGVAVELVDEVHQAFVRVKEIETEEGRTFVHPCEGPKTAVYAVEPEGADTMRRSFAAGSPQSIDFSAALRADRPGRCSRASRGGRA